MKIIIDIPDEVLNDIKSGKKINNIILNGIPLPKRHGRLIDADALEVSMADDWHTANEIANYIKYAPTIIDAESESD